MYISRLQASNFKSFRSIDVELQKYNLIVGANASGKSNFVQILAFLRDIEAHGLEDAVALQGGLEYLTNARIGSTEPLSIGVTIQFARSASVMFLGEFRSEREQRYSLKPDTLRYQISIGSTSSERSVIETITEEIVVAGMLVESSVAQASQAAPYATGDVTIVRSGAWVTVKANFSPSVTIHTWWEHHLSETAQAKGSSLLGSSIPSALFARARWFTDTAVYDIDPRLPKRATQVSGRLQLEEDGNNLALVLNRILKDEDQRVEFTRLIQDLLPFVDSLEIERLVDKSMLLKFRDTYSKDQYFPAYLMSGGTISIMALVVALFFERNSITVIEEPERNIHPHLLARVAEMLKDASKEKQIIATTHSPDLVKHTPVENVLLVSRDKDGFSTISRPSESEAVQVFLQNELGLEDLFVQNLLDA